MGSGLLAGRQGEAGRRMPQDKFRQMDCAPCSGVQGIRLRSSPQREAVNPMLEEPRAMGNGEERGVGTRVLGGAPVLEQQEHQPGPSGWGRGRRSAWPSKIWG